MADFHHFRPREPYRAPRHFGLSSGQWHFVGGVAAMAASLLFALYVLTFVIEAGSGSCPADTGRIPSRTLDGRTVCVLPSEVR